MAKPTESDNPLANASREDIMSALFANMIVQQTNAAFIYLGRTPHPETGQVIQDLESAKFFIDQLEMLEAKTHGNLDQREQSLLKQSLTGLRMAFVEAVDQAQKPHPQQPRGETPGTTAPPAGSAGSAQPTPGAAEPTDATPTEEESRKRFTKKY